MTDSPQSPDSYYLRPDTLGDGPPDCTGAYDCPAPQHSHGCFSDDPCPHGDSPHPPRRRKRRYTHPAHVTADRLKDHTERYIDLMDGRERDDFAAVIQVLEEIGDGTRSR